MTIPLALLIVYNSKTKVQSYLFNTNNKYLALLFSIRETTIILLWWYVCWRQLVNISLSHC
jgi:hypothetical protein